MGSACAQYSHVGGQRNVLSCTAAPPFTLDPTLKGSMTFNNNGKRGNEVKISFDGPVSSRAFIHKIIDRLKYLRYLSSDYL